MSKKNKKKQELEQKPEQAEETSEVIEQGRELVEKSLELAEEVAEVTQEAEAQPVPESKKESLELQGEPVSFKEATVKKDRTQPKPMTEPEKQPAKVENKELVHDPVDYASRHVENFNPSWTDSIRAFQRHLGAAQKMSEPDCIAFLKQWGAKLK